MPVFFNPLEGRTSFFTNNGEVGSLFNFFYLIIRLMSLKSMRPQVTNQLLGVYVKQENGKLVLKEKGFLHHLEGILNSSVIYKIVDAHARQRITVLRKELGLSVTDEAKVELKNNISLEDVFTKVYGRVISSEIVGPTKFSKKEQEEVRAFLSEYFPNEYMSFIDQINGRDVTPDEVCTYLKRTADRATCHASYREFMKYLFERIAKRKGLYQLRDYLNEKKGKYKADLIDVKVEKGQNTIDVVIEMMGILFEVATSTLELAEDLESLSDLKGKRTSTKEIGENVRQGFNLLADNVRTFALAVLKNSDAKDLKYQVINHFVLSADKSQGAQGEVRRVARAARDLANEKIHELSQPKAWLEIINERAKSHEEEIASLKEEIEEIGDKPMPPPRSGSTVQTQEEFEKEKESDKERLEKELAQAQKRHIGNNAILKSLESAFSGQMVSTEVDASEDDELLSMEAMPMEVLELQDFPDFLQAPVEGNANQMTLENPGFAEMEEVLDSDEVDEVDKESLKAQLTEKDDFINRQSHYIQEQRNYINYQVQFSAQLNANLERQKAEVIEKENTIGSLRNQLDVNHKDLIESEKKVDSLSGQLTKKDESLAENQKEIAALEGQLTKKDESLAENQKEIAELEEKLAEKGNDLEERQKEIEELRAQLAKKEEKISSLRSLLFAGLGAYELKRKKEAKYKEGLSEEEMQKINKHKKGRCGKYSFAQKMHALEVLKQFASGELDDLAGDDLGACKNKRLGKEVYKYAKTALSIYGQSTKGSRSAVIDRWVKAEKGLRNPAAA